jgi:hypothetical protein
LVITLDPSAAISASGKPSGRSRWGRVRNPEKLPPVAWVPHSSTWPATTAPASSSYDVGVQPKRAIAGPTTREASVTRPVTTMSAPPLSAAAIPKPPR